MMMMMMILTAEMSPCDHWLLSSSKSLAPETSPSWATGIRRVILLNYRIIYFLNLFMFVIVLHYIAPYAWRQRRFLLTIYMALLPNGSCGSAGWVSNTTHYDCCHYRHMQERNPFGQSVLLWIYLLIYSFIKGLAASFHRIIYQSKLILIKSPLSHGNNNNDNIDNIYCRALLTSSVASVNFSELIKREKWITVTKSRPATEFRPTLPCAMSSLWAMDAALMRLQVAVAMLLAASRMSLSPFEVLSCSWWWVIA